MSDPLERLLPVSAIALGLAVATATVFFVLGGPTPEDPPPLRANPEVRLVVLVVFDQLRADLIARPEWREHFGQGGFRRLQDNGAWFTHCHYPYAITATGPGHAAMLSGASPSRTGIVNNEWYDRREKSEAYCAGESRFELVPAPPKADPGEVASTRTFKTAGSPRRMLVPTVADVLKTYTSGRGKVFGVSLKDRSALLPSGSGATTRPDGAFWFDGRFVTSTYYADAVPEWVATFNASGRADRDFGKDWVRHRPDLDYDKLAGPDDGEGEGSGIGQGRTFPHPMTGGKDKTGLPFTNPKAAGVKFYDALVNSPMGNELLLDFAKACIDAEQLGADDEPDLLTVSFSSNDLIGHTWGPDSHEVLDCTLRSDEILTRLLAHLDAKVGQGKYAILLTADHGICPLPEFAAKHPERYPDAAARSARRVPSKPMRDGAEKHLQAKFGPPRDGKATWIETVKPPYFYLDHARIKAKGLKAETMAEELAAWVRTYDGVAGAYTAAGLRESNLDAMMEKVRLAFHPDRSGDVYVVLQPYLLIGDPDKDNKLPTGTTHGAPQPYDTHVPLLVYGPGVKGGPRAEAVTPLHAAPIAAKFLGVPPPPAAMYTLPKTLQE
ncbi:MAG: alkaline phosphatase family protein [Fimbriiglobus sp.]|jgi:hypothetical protein|nr:alkaline phosphatase family protein [Fimbriiglobus sp.]